LVTPLFRDYFSVKADATLVGATTISVVTYLLGLISKFCSFIPSSNNNSFKFESRAFLFNTNVDVALLFGFHPNVAKIKKFEAALIYFRQISLCSS
jgi:uncharacterized membrane protein